MGISYKDAGVDRELGDKFVDRIRQMVSTTYTPEVMDGVGGFASLYKIDEDRYLAAGCDGVGTKLILAQDLNIHDTIGIDLVAMCVNDVLCTGARPLFFLDYFASGKLNLNISEAVIKGIVVGCREAGAALVGGETAEMPGLYSGQDYDLAGFCVGELYQKDLVDGKNIQIGDDLVALASSGFHSNGFSLVRKLLGEGDESLKRSALAPTKIYVKNVAKALKKFPIKGMAHITGSGFYNVPRINQEFAYRFTQLPELPDFMQQICARSGLDAKELYSTFNMGTGFVLATDRGPELVEFFNSLGERAVLAGKVVAGKGQVFIQARGVDVCLE
jgi:phosphoribosylformylglycinamidine cyclo-ligase